MEEDQIHYMAILMSLWHWKLTSEQSKDLNRQNESSTSPLLHVQHVQKMAAYDNNNTTHCFDVSPLSSHYCYISPHVLNTISLSLSTSLLLYSTHADFKKRFNRKLWYSYISMYIYMYVVYTYIRLPYLFQSFRL